MSGHRFGRADRQTVVSIIAENALDSRCFSLVSQCRRGAVGVDVIDIGGFQARALPGGLHGARGAVAIGAGLHYVESITGHAVSHYFRVYMRTTGEGMLERFQDEN